MKGEQPLLAVEQGRRLQALGDQGRLLAYEEKLRPWAPQLARRRAPREPGVCGAGYKAAPRVDREVLANEARDLGVAQEVKDLVIKFSATAVATLLGAAVGV